jgi:CTP synthase (UTP-ammonia lyase)
MPSLAQKGDGMTAAPATIALVGDYSAQVTAHRAIPLALDLAGAAGSWQWVPSRDLRDAPRDLAAYAAVWVVPASPYANDDGVLAAIRWARETGRPFLGTCGGFQYAMLEVARDLAGLTGATHGETHPDSPTQLLVPLSCSLVEKTGNVHFVPGSRLAKIYGGANTAEGYHCRYGLNPAFLPQLEAAGLRFSGHDDSGEIRAAELVAHPFFVTTLFQPERAALRGIGSPVVRAFVQAAAAYHGVLSS